MSSTNLTKAQIAVTIKQKIRLVNTLSRILIIGGVLSLIFSIIFSYSSSSSVLAFIGLGLVFWGILFIYIQPEEYIRQNVFDSAILSSQTNLDKIISELNYKGPSTYLPPKFFKNNDDIKIYLGKNKRSKVPEPDIIANQEESFFIKDPNGKISGLLINSPGVGLANLFEKRLGKTFAQIDLDYFKRALSKLIVEDLELAEKIDIQLIQNNRTQSSDNSVTVKIKLENSVIKNIYKNTEISNVLETIGDPIISSIACALTKVTGKPLTIDKIESSEDGEIIEVIYAIPNMVYIEKIDSPMVRFVQSLPQLGSLRTRSPAFSKVLPIVLTIFGIIILVWIGNLTLNDVVLYSKRIDVVLLQSRTGEPIDLGIGMKVIYYYIIGFLLLVIGAALNSRSRSRR